MVMFLEDTNPPLQQGPYLSIPFGTNDAHLTLDIEGRRKALIHEKTSILAFAEDIFRNIFEILNKLEIGDVVILSPRTVSEAEGVENYDTFAAFDNIIINYIEINKVAFYQFLLPGHAPIILRSDQVKIDKEAVKIILLNFLSVALENKLPSFITENLRSGSQDLTYLVPKLIEAIVIRSYRKSSS